MPLVLQTAEALARPFVMVGVGVARMLDCRRFSNHFTVGLWEDDCGIPVSPDLNVKLPDL